MFGEVLVNRSAPSWLLLLLLCSTLCGAPDGCYELLDLRLGSLAHWQQGLEADEEGGANGGQCLYISLNELSRFI